jgi:DNA processing protein
VDTLRLPLCIEPRSSSWPEELEEIERGPERLWLRGRLEILDRRPRVAIVGTRAPSPYGEAQARRFALALAERGVCVVSGLARGIDHAAHRAALDANGATIAVLGSGVDRPWPTGALTDEMAERGLLMSEFHPGEGPRPHHFPLRNRVISGLCDGVLVIEAAHASGSLITAHWAADQGRAVWALPGRVDQPMSRGTHRLIREGAQLVESPDEILIEIGAGVATAAEPGNPAAREKGTNNGTALSPVAQRVLERLRGETYSADELAARLDLDAREVLVALVELEVADRVVRAPGGLYRLAK